MEILDVELISINSLKTSIAISLLNRNHPKNNVLLGFNKIWLTGIHITFTLIFFWVVYCANGECSLLISLLLERY